MTGRPVLTNRLARRLFLDLHALAEPPTGPASGPDLLALIRRLGFVQLDSINTVARAHHMILHARRQTYRPAALDRLHQRDRTLFEHWTHDAALIPTEFYPHWKHLFARQRQRIPERWTAWQGEGFDREVAAVREHVARNGACGTAEVGEGEERRSGGWWEWNPSKTALEFLWHTGEFAIVRRDSFRKVYDLAHRVVPEPFLSAEHPPEATRDWAAGAALDRLGFASSGDLAAFWGRLLMPDEARDWARAGLADGSLIEVEVEGADGSRRRSLARPDVIGRAEAAAEPPPLIRILSPFDPALRDRDRAERLFGFSYRIEIFVPAHRRRYGYYVFPVLEGDRIVGRIDMKADRAADRLQVTAFWPEPGISLGKGRLDRLSAALARSARLAEVSDVRFADGWQRG